MWGLYMIRYSDSKIYIGISKDIDNRFKQHCRNKGAKCLKNKKLLLIYRTPNIYTHRDALVIEYYLKRTPKQTKEFVVQVSPKDLILFLYKYRIIVEKLRNKHIFPITQE